MAALTREQAAEILRLKAGSGKQSAARIAGQTGKYRGGKHAGENYSEEAVGKLLDIARAVFAGVRLHYLRVEAPLVRAVLAALRSGNRAGDED